MGKTKTVITVISKISERPVAQDAALVVIHGLDLGRKYDLAKPTLVIGRSSKCAVQVDQESVSRNHARISSQDGVVTVEDLESTNGTYVNDEPVKAKVQLRNGDLIKVGRTIFKFLAGGNIEAAYHDEVYRLTTVDGLTQAFNRRYFEDTLERELSRCSRYGRALSLIMLDIDNFKVINDSHGHLAGDYVLRQVSAAIKTKIRREDILARYGGEEFALLLPEVDLKGAAALAEKTRKLIEKHRFEFDKAVMPVTVSAGVATIASKSADPAELVREADLRLYAAKESGRNRVVSDS
ncbi:MAG: GGDEF domain-containing protein [Myxococcaceae bacterium]|nr:GGDEF domain-containing protein [Myxococcaceae bacterium]